MAVGVLGQQLVTRHKVWFLGLWHTHSLQRALGSCSQCGPSQGEFLHGGHPSKGGWCCESPGPKALSSPVGNLLP